MDATRWMEAEACLLCRALLDAHKFSGFGSRYKKPIDCLVDGTVVSLGTSRKTTVLQRSTWSNKAKGNAARDVGTMVAR